MQVKAGRERVLEGGAAAGAALISLQIQPATVHLYSAGYHATGSRS